MYLPALDDESTTTVNYIDQQLDAVRASAFGLTEAQARETACRSELSIAGIIKHVTYVMRGAEKHATEGPRLSAPDEAGFAAFMASFTPTDEETTEALLSEFDRARQAYLAAVRGVEPGGDTMVPPAPWDGILDARPVKWRYFLQHQLEEMARHAGHADIIREQLDGARVPQLVMTRAGAPANPFFTPFEPQPGTVTA